MAAPFTSTEDMATIAEQIRKTATAASEQARQTVAAAQEQLKGQAAQAEQVQHDLAQTMLRLGEQNSQLVTAAFASFWDASLSMLNLATWSQEQIERTTRQLIDQGRLSREEGLTVIRQATEQARGHQAELYRLAQESLRTGLMAMPVAGHPPAAADAAPSPGPKQHH